MQIAICNNSEEQWEQLEVGSLMEAIMLTEHKKGVLFFWEGEELFQVDFQKIGGIDNAEMSDLFRVPPPWLKFETIEILAIKPD